MKKNIFLLTILLFSACNQAPIAPTPQSTMPGPQETATVMIKPPTTQPLLEIPSPIPTLPSAILWPTHTPIPGLPAGQPVKLTSIRMIDANTGWAFEKNRRILHTVDGGNTWQDVTPPEGSNYSEGGFFALDADTAWATPDLWLCFGNDCTFATVWRTDNGGATWVSSPLCLNVSASCSYNFDVVTRYYFARQMQFVNKNTGWLLVSVASWMKQDRYRIYHTTDGGIHWEFTIDNLQGPSVAGAPGLAFLDEKNGWFAINQVGGAEDPAPNWYAYKTTDAGKTWQKTELPAPSPLPAEFNGRVYWCGARKVDIIQPEIVDLMFICRVYEQASDSLAFYFRFHSFDGGENWNSWLSKNWYYWYSEKGASSYSIFEGNDSFLNAQIGWRLYPLGEGQNSQLQQTTDGGQTWKTVKTVAWQTAQFDFVSEQIGWAIVNSAKATALVHTIDGGQTWEVIKPIIVSPTPNIQATINAGAVGTLTDLAPSATSTPDMFTRVPSVTSTPDMSTLKDSVNVAVGKPVVDRAGGVNYDPWGHANDAADYKSTTKAGGGRWGIQTNAGGGTYQVIDLESVYMITGVGYSLDWDGAFKNPLKYVVQVSNDLETWVTVSELTHPYDGITGSNWVNIKLQIDPVNARYVKFWEPPDGAWNGWGDFFELRVYSKAK